MENATPLQEDGSWGKMLEEFSALGGVVENIVPRKCGLYAIDPAESVLVRVPRDLVIRVGDIEFIDGRILVGEAAGTPKPARRFFERYANAFSWGAARKSENIAFLTALDALPVEIRSVLIAELGLGALLQGDFDERVQRRFLHSRRVVWRGQRVIAPLIELANYGMDGLRYERGASLQIQGNVRDEARVRYGGNDAWSIFHQFGIVSPEPAAFSLRMTANFVGSELLIGRKITESTPRGGDRVPKVTVEKGRITLSYLMLGHRKFPGLPRGTFRALLGEAGVKNADELFDEILRFNALKFIHLLKALEPYEGEMISTLRTMARYQLEAMACCIGSRKLDPAADSSGRMRVLPREMPGS